MGYSWISFPKFLIQHELWFCVNSRNFMAYPLVDNWQFHYRTQTLKHAYTIQMCCYTTSIFKWLYIVQIVSGRVYEKKTGGHTMEYIAECFAHSMCKSHSDTNFDFQFNALQLVIYCYSIFSHGFSVLWGNFWFNNLYNSHFYRKSIENLAFKRLKITCVL